ncbi:Carboxylesterase type B [Penicillium longicatenatum]|uniref:Carboxylesterase type B n=1 Tax=Penicillium longicatenatum TaxID=1561947 RepID=UPI00254869AF|nr:Carboxylesterase type B [Penicillium longicatenatum]KAJ5630200.1 Carboxylesterase type B [Penicillium longicatenatum]
MRDTLGLELGANRIFPDGVYGYAQYVDSILWDGRADGFCDYAYACADHLGVADVGQEEDWGHECVHGWNIDNPDFIAGFTLFILWSEMEVNVAMIVCCMPVFGPVLGQWRETLYHHYGHSEEGEFGLLRHSASASTKEGETHLTTLSTFGGSDAHHEQGGYEARLDDPYR